MNLKYVGLMAWYYGLKAIPRGPSYIIAALMTPLSLLFIVFIITKGELVKFAIVGGFVITVASVALSSAGDAAFMRLQLRMQDLYVPTRVSPSDYMLALTLSYLMFSIPGIALYSILGVIFHVFNTIAIFVLIAVVVLLVIATSSISFIISGMIKHVRNVWGIAAILSVAMTVLPPTFYPYNYIPRYALYVLSISPVTPAAVIAQSIFHLSPMLLIEVPVLILETAVLFVLARFLTRWREN